MSNEIDMWNDLDQAEAGLARAVQSKNSYLIKIRQERVEEVKRELITAYPDLALND